MLFISADPVGETMAGLGIRCWELARALSRQASVTVAHGGTEAGEHEGVRMLPFRPHAPGALQAPIAEAEMILAHPQWPLVNRWFRHAAGRVVIDLYCPETLETLELTAERGRRVRAQHVETTLDRLHSALRTGHNFVCASESQRDLWIGTMLALRLIGPGLYDRDPSLRETIDLVPFGAPSGPPPEPSPGGPRDSIAGIDRDSELVLWNGGIWRWLDAESAIRAVASLVPTRPRLRLVFMGGAPSHPAAAESTRSARALAAELDLLDSVVHFHDSWVPYDERGAWLAQADCALSAHAEHLETRFAYRTRVLDCFWARLPIVCTSGDELAERIQRERLGAVAPPQDVPALASALAQVLDAGRVGYADRLAVAAEQSSWERVARPLARWLATPRPNARLGDTSGAVRAPIAQRLREGAYLIGGRKLLDMRRDST
ncbi:MAG TPA: glycosyltransferase [Solirubrobacteraceae bacterium]|nr:glycosyltransferase [Solirubrobacteraceae bacterium]